MTEETITVAGATAEVLTGEIIITIDVTAVVTTEGTVTPAHT